MKKLNFYLNANNVTEEAKKWFVVLSSCMQKKQLQADSEPFLIIIATWDVVQRDTLAALQKWMSFQQWKLLY